MCDFLKQEKRKKRKESAIMSESFTVTLQPTDRNNAVTENLQGPFLCTQSFYCAKAKAKTIKKNRNKY